jgi:hypothetical protein
MLAVHEKAQRIVYEQFWNLSDSEDAVAAGRVYPDPGETADYELDTEDLERLALFLLRELSTVKAERAVLLAELEDLQKTLDSITDAWTEQGDANE